MSSAAHRDSKENSIKMSESFISVEEMGENSIKSVHEKFILLPPSRTVELRLRTHKPENYHRQNKRRIRITMRSKFGPRNKLNDNSLHLSIHERRNVDVEMLTLEHGYTDLEPKIQHFDEKNRI